MGATHGSERNTNDTDGGHWNNGIVLNNLEELKHYFRKEKQDPTQNKKKNGNILVIGNNSHVKYDYFRYLNVYNKLEKDNIGNYKKKDISKVKNKLFVELEKEYEKYVEEKIQKRFLSVKMALLSFKMMSDVNNNSDEIATDVINIIMDYYESSDSDGVKCNYNDDIQCIKVNADKKSVESTKKWNRKISSSYSSYLKKNRESLGLDCVYCSFYPTLTNMSNFKVLEKFLCDLDKTGEIDCVIFVVSLMDYKSSKLNEMIDYYDRLTFELV